MNLHICKAHNILFEHLFYCDIFTCTMSSSASNRYREINNDEFNKMTNKHLMCDYHTNIFIHKDIDKFKLFYFFHHHTLTTNRKDSFHKCRYINLTELTTKKLLKLKAFIVEDNL